MKYCPDCYNILDYNDICFHCEKPHPRSNRAYSCSKCKKVSCWIELVERDESVNIQPL